MFDLASPQDLLSLISVRPPYFALEDLAIEAGNVVSATVPVQQSLEREIPPMSACEAGRHLAILGACSSALVNPRQAQHYYLAHEASYKRHQLDVGVQGKLYARGQSRFTDKRSAAASTTMATAEGQTVCTLDVQYNVIAKKIYERIFAGHRTAEATAIGQHANPYAVIQHNPFAHKELKGDTIIGVKAGVRAEECVGHFHHFPALPVSVVLYNIGILIGDLIADQTGIADARWYVEQTVIRAESLAFAGEEITFTVTHADTCGDALRFEGTALTADNKMVGGFECNAVVAHEGAASAQAVKSA